MIRFTTKLTLFALFLLTFASLATEEAPSLTKEEQKSISSYTHVQYRPINNFLRFGRAVGGRRVYTEDEIKKEIELLSNSLNKLPNFTGRVYRGANCLPGGLSGPQIETLSKKKKEVYLQEKSFLSTSKNINSAFDDMNYFMSIESKSGKNISTYSDYKSENEVLFNPLTCLKYNGKTRSNLYRFKEMSPKKCEAYFNDIN